MRPGYKQTEVGVIPEDWKEISLGQLAEIRMCKRVFSEQTSPYGDIPFFKIGTFGKTPDAFISASLYQEYKSKYSFPKKGDVLLSAAGTLGRTVVFDGQDAYFQDSNIVWLEIDHGKLTNEYLYQCYQTIRWASPEGSTISRLYNGIIKKTKIPLPPTKEEQRAIAAALSDMDALLDGLERLIAKKRDIKQATMQQLLTGKTRLLGFSGAWEVKRLGDICDISMGRTPPRLNTAMWGDGHIWLSIADMNGKIVSSSKEEITDLAASEMKVVPKGTLMMSFKLSIGRLCFAGCDLYTNEAICAFNNLKDNSDFLYYALSRVDFSLYGKQAVKGYTLNKESLRLVEIAIPTKEEQTAIANILSDMDAEIAALEARRDKTRHLKQAMMQELLTGKTRLV